MRIQSRQKDIMKFIDLDLSKTMVGGYLTGQRRDLERRTTTPVNSVKSQKRRLESLDDSEV